MATFAKTTYNAAYYASVRPTYPRQLFDMLFRFHSRDSQKARWGRAVDLGCGTGAYLLPLVSLPDTLTHDHNAGQATRELTPFRTVIGVEPSSKMIAQAQAQSQAQSSGEGALMEGVPGQISYVQSAAESLPFLEDGSVDMIVSGQF